MDATPIGGGLMVNGSTAPILFTIANASDNADICRLLRENSMEGSLHISLEREPDAFASHADLALSHHFVLARDGHTGQAIGVCERSIYEMYVNNTALKVPYIGGLRVASSHRNRIRILRGGFAKLRTISQGDDTTLAITSISEDNSVALRILTSGVKGLPHYNPIGNFSVMVIAARKFPYMDGELADTRMLAHSATAWNKEHQFGTVWTESHLKKLENYGILPENRVMLSCGSSVKGTIALWDQRNYRQAVIRRFPPALGVLRPFYNLIARYTGKPRLPALGCPMDVAVASHFSWTDGDEQTFIRLVHAVLGRAYLLGLSAVAFGFAIDSRCYKILRRHFPHAMEFRTRFFSVMWPDERHSLPALDSRPLHPELGIV